MREREGDDGVGGGGVGGGGGGEGGGVGGRYCDCLAVS